MFSLEPVGAQHEAAILAFELRNRTYFAGSISDRGDAYFAHFPGRHRELLAKQEAGTGAFYVLVDGDGAVVGRFNLYEVSDGSAAVGYRVAEWIAGRGEATSGLRRLCRIAHEDLGLGTLTAATSGENLASQRVLAKVGFVSVGTTEVEGRPGPKFTLDLGTD